MQSDLQHSKLEKILRDFAAGDDGRTVCLRCVSPVEFTYSIKGGQPRPAASVMKLPLIMAIYQSAAQNFTDLNQRTPVSSFAGTRYVSVLAAFEPTTTFSLKEICRLAIITSDNPLMVHLQSRISFDDVNKLSESFAGPGECHMAAGFSEGELGPANLTNIITGDACLKLLNELRVNPLYSDMLKAMQNNMRGNRIPALLPETATVAHKTGSLAGVVNDIGMVDDGNILFDIAFLSTDQNDPARTTNEIANCALSIYQALE